MCDFHTACDVCDCVIIIVFNTVTYFCVRWQQSQNANRIKSGDKKWKRKEKKRKKKKHPARTYTRETDRAQEWKRSLWHSLVNFVSIKIYIDYCTFSIWLWVLCVTFVPQPNPTVSISFGRGKFDFYYLWTLIILNANFQTFVSTLNPTRKMNYNTLRATIGMDLFRLRAINAKKALRRHVKMANK